MKEITQALVSAMEMIDGVEKSMVVGTGSNAYRAVSDKDVKLKVRAALRANGLVIVPIGVKDEVTIERWTEDTQYGPKTKQQVFTKVTTKYLILHTSGESIEAESYGHGIDTQDKSSGKALTYAAKSLVLALFQIPTGDIEDTDATHSDDLQTPAATATKTTPGAKKTIPKAREVAKLLRACKTLDELKDTFEQLTASEKTNFKFVKDEMKVKLSPPEEPSATAITDKEAELRSAGDLDTLAAIWKTLTPEEQVTYKAIKDELKTDLLAVEEIQANLQGESAQ